MMMKLNGIALCGACAACLLISPVSAQRPGGEGQRGGRPGPEAMFERFDANKDGKLTEDELPERAAQMIMKADANGDKAVTLDEIKAAQAKRGEGRPGVGRPAPEEIIKRFDKNGDGKLSKDEIPEGMAARLGQADGDGDGTVTKEELEAAFKKMQGRRGGQGTPPGRGQFDPAQLFQRLDRNSDGKVTKDELPEQMAERMMRADADGNGEITKEEFLKAHEKFQGRTGQRGGPKDGQRKRPN